MSLPDGCTQKELDRALEELCEDCGGTGRVRRVVWHPGHEDWEEWTEDCSTCNRASYGNPDNRPLGEEVGEDGDIEF